MDNRSIFLAVLSSYISSLDSTRPELALKSIVQPHWTGIKELAANQGITALFFDTINVLPISLRPDKKFLLNWFGQVTYIESKYDSHKSALESLTKLYENNGIRAMLLKGYGLSLFWPIPNHRAPGDIDIYLFGNQKEADQKFASQYNIKIDNSHHHHSVFRFKGVTVENHYDFLNVHSHKSNVWIEEMFKKMAIEEPVIEDQSIKNLYYPSYTLNALYVARHAACHFASEKIKIRHLLDWAFLIRVTHDKIDWERFWNEVKKMNMQKFVSCMNIICYRYLGFSETIFHQPEYIHKDYALADRMLNNIFDPDDTGSKKKGLDYIIHRTKLWWNNRWKHRMVYSDSLLSTFATQLKSHLMKPNTIFRV